VKRWLILWGVLFIACFSPFSVKAPAFAENIKVGVLLPLSGRLSELGGVTASLSFQLAADKINATGGIGGKKIELIVEDTAGARNVGTSAIEKLISKDKVVVVAGGFSSTVAWAASAVAQERKVPFLVNTASADKITEERRDYIFRLNTPISEQTRELGSFLKEVLSVNNAAILYEKTYLGQYLANRFMKQCRSWDLDVVGEESFRVDSPELETLLREIALIDPDLVYLISEAKEGSELMRKAKEVGLSPRIFLGNPSGFAIPEFQKEAGDVSAYVYAPVIWTPSVPYPGAGQYYDAFIQRHGFPPDYHGAQAYAAMQVISDAVKRAQILTPEGIREALAGTNLMSVLGPVRFVSYGKKIQQNRLPTYMVQWINSRLEIVWPEQVASTHYIYPTPKWDERF
jgi:branched-chain amino acid transport system substrate-binding protein